MKIKPLLAQLRPRAVACWRGLPIFGPILDDFVQWLADKGYARGTIANYLKTVPKVIRWLRRHQITSLDQLTQQQLRLAHDYYRPRQQDPSWVIGALERFLSQRRLVPEGDSPRPSAVEVEVERFGAYLRETRGVAEATVLNHSRRLRPFLHYLGFDGDSAPLRQLAGRQIEAFLRKSAPTNNRFSMQHIVGTLRAYLKERHAQGVLPRPWHLQIDTPRVYRGESLPRALPWAQVQAFIRSIDCSEPFGRRDFTLLYLAAAYGLRSGELVRLTLDDIDWRGRSLRITQTKTRQTLQLPLTDEAANVLIDYLRQARPQSDRRQLFLRIRAPFVPLQPASVHDVLEHRLRCSGLNLPPFGTHVLRHSFATRLMQQEVGIKAIGDALGHRDIESTSVYLRLNVEELRTVTVELRPYLHRRRQEKLPMAPAAFLMWSPRRSPEVYADNNLVALWHRLCISVRVLDAQGHPPRVHDLRHSCAVLVLQRWYAPGADVQAKLPHLAAYLGHLSAVSTHHYLKLTPELRQAASQRFHQRFGTLLTSGGAQ